MSRRWIALHCSDEAEVLQARHPNAFLQLCQIARRAKWKDCPITGLKAGQALIGDWKEAGIHSEMAYRIAKEKLADSGLATFQPTNKGTIATLANAAIFSLSPPPDNERGNDPATDKQRPSNRPTTTNHTDTQNTRTPFALNGASSAPPPKISWSAESGFTGITAKDMTEWEEAFPAVDIKRQLAAASRWLKDNPKKRKQQVGRFITGWLSRQQERGGDIPTSKPKTRELSASDCSI